MTLPHALAAVALLCWTGAQATQMTVTTLARGDQSGIEEPRTMVVRTAAEWSALWKAHAGERTLPAVDFTRSMVIAVFTGSRPTAGHGVEVVRVEKRDAGVVVIYREQRPAPSDMVAQVLTSPFHIVQTASHAGPVTFERAR
jgi:hypothetical protein